MQNEVKVGQIWVDNDKRAAGRQLKILTVDKAPPGKQLSSGYATAEVISDRRAGLRTNRQTCILLSRFKPNSTGYRLVKDA